MCFGAVVGAKVANIHIERDGLQLGPGVNGQVGLGQQHHTGDAAVAGEGVEHLCYGVQLGAGYGGQAVLAQCLGLCEGCAQRVALFEVSGEV